jgi:hypothetical protein
MPFARLDNVFNVLIGCSVVAALMFSVWHYLIKKDYHFLVEASCDPALETCYFRDCSNPDDCPIGELEYYHVSRIWASDFSLCSDNTCAAECSAGTITCEQIACDEEAGDVCVYEPQPVEDIDSEQDLDSEEESL